MSAPQDNPLALDLSTEVARLLTRSIAVRLINELDLLNSPEFNPELATEPPLARLLGSLRSRIKPEPERPAAAADLMELALPTFLNALSVQRLADVIVIGFTSRDPALAARVPNEVVRIYLDERGRKLQERVHSAEGWIDARIAEQRERVTQAQAAVKSLRDTEAPSSEDVQGDASRIMTDLMARRATMEATRAGIQGPLSALESAASLAQAAEAIDSAGMTELRRDLQRQQADLAKLLEVYGDNYPSVIDARAHVEETQAAMAKEAERYIQSLRNQIAGLDRQERDDLGRPRRGGGRPRPGAHRPGQARRAGAQRRGRANRARRARAAEAEPRDPGRIARCGRRGPVARCDAARAARPWAVVLPAGLVFRLRARLPSRSPSVSTFSIAAFAASSSSAGVPNLKPAGLVPRLPRRLGPVEALRQPRSPFPTRSTTWQWPSSAPAMANRRRSILVTSGLPNEGKSTLALTLAVALTARGRRVLLVDGDPRHGTVHRSLSAQSEPGLSNFLCGRAEIGAVVQASKALGIDFIPRGSQSLPLHDVGRAKELLAYARQQGMTVIVDGPPALAATETLALAGLVERNLVVARWGKTSRREVELAVRRLQEWNLDEILLVLNMVDVRRYALYGFKDAGLFAKELRKYYGPLG